MCSKPNLPVKQSVTIDTMKNFDSDWHGYVNSKCKQAFWLAFFAEPKAWRIHEFPYGGDISPKGGGANVVFWPFVSKKTAWNWK